MIDPITESELWGKLAALCTETAELAAEKTIVTLMEVMRGANIDPVALSWHVDKRLSAEIKTVCIQMGIPYDNTASVTVITEDKEEVGH